MGLLMQDLYPGSSYAVLYSLQTEISDCTPQESTDQYSDLEVKIGHIFTGLHRYVLLGIELCLRRDCYFLKKWSTVFALLGTHG